MVSNTEFSRRWFMLVLTRHRGEQLVIADDVVVTIVAIEGNKVRIGVAAPKSVRVDRKEVHDRRIADELAVSEEIEAGCPVG
jgi:carbon storage regulator